MTCYLQRFRILVPSKPPDLSDTIWVPITWFLQGFSQNECWWYCLWYHHQLILKWAKTIGKISVWCFSARLCAPLFELMFERLLGFQIGWSLNEITEGAEGTAEGLRKAPRKVGQSLCDATANIVLQKTCKLQWFWLIFGVSNVAQKKQKKFQRPVKHNTFVTVSSWNANEITEGAAEGDQNLLRKGFAEGGKSYLRKVNFSNS